jgi:hypothetical protein
MARRHQETGIDTDPRRGQRSRFGEDGAVDEIDAFDGDGFSWGVDEDLEEASMEDLRELADELEIEDYETLSREDLKREIRKETRAEP